MQTAVDIRGPIAPPRPSRWARTARHVRKNAVAYGLILPSLVFLAAVEFYPLGVGLLEGFKYHSRVQPWLTHYNGLENYRQALDDPAVRESLRVSLVAVTSIVAVSYVLGLVAAVLLNQRIRFRGVYRAVILVPWVVPPVVAYISWQFMFADEGGFLNETLRRLGLIDEPILWLSKPNLALGALIAVGVWSRIGFMMITILAALAAIPDDLHEAAAIDGASRWQTFRHVTFPLILPVSIIATLLQAIWTFNDFALPFVLTGGGPANATTTLSLLSYREAFQRFNIGYGTSLAVISMVLMLFVGAVYLRMQAKRTLYESGGA
ncbi:MAG: sugar ABC transporter permease [Chloroflexota bacterium]|nr:sugar ABC transporter permease [Chloroflexota bacterium]